MSVFMNHVFPNISHFNGLNSIIIVTVTVLTLFKSHLSWTSTSKRQHFFLQTSMVTLYFSPWRISFRKPVFSPATFAVQSLSPSSSHSDMMRGRCAYCHITPHILRTINTLKLLLFDRVQLHQAHYELHVLISEDTK